MGIFGVLRGLSSENQIVLKLSPSRLVRYRNSPYQLSLYQKQTQMWNLRKILQYHHLEIQFLPRAVLLKIYLVRKMTRFGIWLLQEKSRNTKKRRSNGQQLMLEWTKKVPKVRPLELRVQNFSM